MCAPGRGVEMTIRIRDIDRMRLLIWELKQLNDRMRVMANPEREALSGIINRFMVDSDGDRVD